MAHLNTLKHKTHKLNVAIYALFVAYKDNRVKWYTKFIPAFVMAYAVSPIDFIPDLVAVFGFLDDVVMIAMGGNLTYQLINREVLNEARLQAYEGLSCDGENTAAAYRVVGYVWMLALTLLAVFCYKLLFMQML